MTCEVGFSVLIPRWLERGLLSTTPSGYLGLFPNMSGMKKVRKPCLECVDAIHNLKGSRRGRNLPCVTHGGSTAIEFEIPDMLLLVRRGLKRSTGKGKYRRRAPGKYLIHV